MTWTEEVLLIGDGIPNVPLGIWDPKLKILCATIPLKGMGGPIYNDIYTYNPFLRPG